MLSNFLLIFNEGLFNCLSQLRNYILSLIILSEETSLDSILKPVNAEVNIYLLKYNKIEEKMNKESDIQFKDYLFMNRLNLIHNSRNSQPKVLQLKIVRSTWTKKIMRQKQNERKLNNIHSFLEDSIFKHSVLLSRSYHMRNQSKSIKFDHQNHEKRISCHKRISQQNQRYKQSTVMTHIALNRNVYNEAVYQDLSKSQILFQKNENATQSRPVNKISSPKLLLKNLKIKNNINLYKGNFKKFTKNDSIHVNKSKCPNLRNDLDLSPWQQDDRINFLA